MPVTAAVLRELARAGLSADELVAAAERIEAADRPTSGAERTRAWRERQKAIGDGVTRNVTASQAPPRKEGFPPPPFEETQPPPKDPLKGVQKVPAPSSTRGTRLPENFEPSTEDALATGLTASAISEERLKFRDYWRAKPGQGGVKTDWPATWRNWCRKAAADRGLKPPPKAGAPPGAGTDALWLQRAWDYANDGWYRDWGSPRDIPPEHRHRFPNLDKWKSEFPAMDQTQGTA